MDNVLQEVQEYIIISNSDETESWIQSYTSWPRNVSKRLISLYQEHHSQIGVKIRKQRQLWEILSNILNREFNLKLTPSQVENKWRTLLRAYKAIIDNNNKTGRARKMFEFQQDMDAIFQKKKNINPEVLLSEDTIASVPKNVSRPSNSGLAKESNDENEGSVLETPTCSKTLSREKIETNKVYIKKRRVLPRNEILEKIRLDRQKQHEERMKKVEERLIIEKEKLMERRRNNEIQEEQNKIFKQYLDILFSKNT